MVLHLISTQCCAKATATRTSSTTKLCGHDSHGNQSRDRVIEDFIRSTVDSLTSFASDDLKNFPMATTKIPTDLPDPA